jgi:hypothetical protein
MVVATVALGKDHSVDLYCERSKTAEAEALLKKPWVGLTDKDRLQILDATEGDERGFVMKLVEDRLKEKNNAML